eukprot:TRINITY_DN3567_c0_g1_i1.p1 TRINITY_DN3567_c0_g1~~TRINITY_DN3567_c0_g1_i1.p1  ORF type:complete len:394 (+),score=14.86 TRINITY_DN3567_c0_g1_i1:105-1286(+)
MGSVRELFILVLVTTWCLSSGQISSTELFPNVIYTENVDFQTFKYYKVANTDGAVQIGLVSLTGDADIYISSVVAIPSFSSFQRQSRELLPIDAVYLTASTPNIYIGIYGFNRNTRFSLLVLALNSSYPIPGSDSAANPPEEGQIDTLRSTPSSVTLRWWPNQRTHLPTTYRVYSRRWTNSSILTEFITPADIIRTGTPMTPWMANTTAVLTGLPTELEGFFARQVQVGIRTVFQVIAMTDEGVMTSYMPKIMTPGVSESGTAGIFGAILDALWVVMGAMILFAALLVICTWACVRRVRLQEMERVSNRRAAEYMQQRQAQGMEMQPMSGVYAPHRLLLPPGLNARPLLLVPVPMLALPLTFNERTNEQFAPMVVVERDGVALPPELPSVLPV